MQRGKFFKTGRLMFVSSLAVCTVWTLPQQSRAEADPFLATAKIQLVDDEDDRRAKRDFAEAVDDAYVYYLTQVKGFNPHIYGAAQVKEGAAAHAAKLDALLKANPQARDQKLGTIIRNQSA